MICSDEGLTLETSAFQSLYGGQFTLSTPLINLIFRVSLPHRRSTTVSLETNPLYSFVVKTLRPLIPSKPFSIHRFLTPRPKTTMPNLKNLTKELRQEIVSYLFPFPPCTTNLAFRLATLIFAKTRFCSHINFIGRCLQSKVIPKGFRSNFHASSFSRSNQYLYQIQCAWICSDEGLTLETSAFQSLYGGQFTLSTPLINPIFRVCQHVCQLLMSRSDTFANLSLPSNTRFANLGFARNTRLPTINCLPCEGALT